MKNNKKKGFTLVELLVVIAILAILASVSVVGYLSFTEKAKISNVEVEMTQARTVIQAEFLDKGMVEVEVSGTKYNVSLTDTDITITKGNEVVSDSNTINLAIEALSNELESFPGVFSISNGSLIYSNDGYAAIWNIAENTVIGYKN